MTREQVVKLFPDATEEQITGLLNQSKAEVEKEKNKVAQYKEKADKADELQTKINEMEAGNLSEIEKAQKALEVANNKIAELERKNALAEQRTTAMNKFKVTAEQASQIIKDDGSFDYDVLGQIISDKEIAAAKAKETEISDHSTNPSGGSSGSNSGEKPKDVENAERISFGATASDEATKNYYVL